VARVKSSPLRQGSGFWAASLPNVGHTNKACIGRVGLCGFEKQFSGFGLFYISNSFLAHPPLTQAVGWQRLRAKPNTSLIRKVDFMFGSKIQNHFLAVAFFKVKFLVNIFFQQASFQVLGFLFIGFHFISKVSGGLCRVAKISVKVFKSSFGQLWF